MFLHLNYLIMARHDDRLVLSKPSESEAQSPSFSETSGQRLIVGAFGEDIASVYPLEPLKSSQFTTSFMIDHNGELQEEPVCGAMSNLSCDVVSHGCNAASTSP